MTLEAYTHWFTQHTADIRSRIAMEPNPQETWGWPTENKAAVLDEVDLKIEHTYLVRDHCIEIARWLKLPAEDITLAALTGLFHDLGRFRQSLLFGTMDDRVTGCHGNLSAAVFLEETPHTGLKEVPLLADAIRYHNQFKLPELPPRALLFAKLVRDADKLDIFRFHTNAMETRKFRFIMTRTEGDYNPEMLAGLLRGENLRVSSIRNHKDRQLLLISLIFDLNFGYSLLWLLEQQIIEKITGIADGTADAVMRQVYDFVLAEVKKKAPSA